MTHNEALTFYWTENMLKRKGITVDCTGKDGGTYRLLALAEELGRDMGWSDRQLSTCLTELKSRNYEHLVHTFERMFGFYVTLKFE